MLPLLSIVRATFTVTVGGVWVSEQRAAAGGLCCHLPYNKSHLLLYAAASRAGSILSIQYAWS